MTMLATLLTMTLVGLPGEPDLIVVRSVEVKGVIVGEPGPEGRYGLTITARGLAGPGWVQPRLIPRRNKAPDGLGWYEFDLVATRSSDPDGPASKEVEARVTIPNLDVPRPGFFTTQGVRVFGRESVAEKRIIAAVGTAPDPSTTEPAPIRVVAVEVNRTPGIDGNPVLVITAKGEVGTSGWRNAALVPVRNKVPDGHGWMNFDLVATPPGPGVVASVIEPIEARKTIHADGVAGMRIYGAKGTKAEKRLGGR